MKPHERKLFGVRRSEYRVHQQRSGRVRPLPGSLRLRADGAWVYYAVPAENYFILTWMEDAEKAAAKVNSLKDEDDSLACIVDLTQEWTRAAE